MIVTNILHHLPSVQYHVNVAASNMLFMDCIIIFVTYILNKRAIALPSLKKDAKIPVFLNCSELDQLIK